MGSPLPQIPALLLQDPAGLLAGRGKWGEFLSGYGSCGNASRRLGAGPLPHQFLPLTVSVWYDFFPPFLPLIQILSFSIILSDTSCTWSSGCRDSSPWWSDPGWTKLHPRSGHLVSTGLYSTRRHSMTLGHEKGGQPGPGNQVRGERGFLEGVSLELSSGLKGSRSGEESRVCVWMNGCVSMCMHVCVWINRCVPVYMHACEYTTHV